MRMHATYNWLNDSALSIFYVHTRHRVLEHSNINIKISAICTKQILLQQSTSAVHSHYRMCNGHLINIIWFSSIIFKSQILTGI